MPNVVVLPNVSRQLGSFFGELVGQHIPDLLDQLEDYMRVAVAAVEQCPEGERKDALLAQRSAIFRLLEMARAKADEL